MMHESHFLAAGKLNNFIAKGVKTVIVLSLLASHNAVIARSSFCPEILDPTTVTWTTTIECNIVEAPLDYWIEPLGNVTFRATDYILLGEGFYVGEGSQFRAFMVDSHLQFVCGLSCH